MRTATASVQGMCRKCLGLKKLVIKIKGTNGEAKATTVPCPSCGGKGSGLATK